MMKNTFSKPFNAKAQNRESSAGFQPAPTEQAGWKPALLLRLTFS